MNDWQKYHDATVITQVYGHWSTRDQLSYAGLGLVNEAGEVAGELKKLLRDDDGQLTDERRERVIDEAGDVLWYLARVLESAGASLEDAAAANVAKVERRIANGTLKGAGDR